MNCSRKGALSLVGYARKISIEQRQKVVEVLTVKVGFVIEVEVDDSASEALASSACTMAAASATVAPIAKRIVLACCPGKSRGLVKG